MKRMNKKFLTESRRHGGMLLLSNQARLSVPLCLCERKIQIIDLQWFAAEDEGRTEEPTEHKIRKAREEGRVAKSQDLTSALVLLFPALAILFLARYILRTCIEMLRFFLERVAEIDPARSGIAAEAFFSYFARLALPIAAAAVVAAIFANMVQTGPLFTAKALVPDFSKVVPHFGRYFQRTLFSVEGIFGIAKSMVKMAIIGGTAYFLIRSRIEELANLQHADLWTGFTLVAGIAIRMLLISAILMLLLSIPDFLFQRWQFRESLRMSVQEVKEERKQYEGDPQIRAQIQRRFREFINKNMAANVARAAVVVTNPTHYSCALELKHDSWGDLLPMLTAKGEDEIAFRIRKIARDNGVPLVENKVLARGLYDNVEVGAFVPEQYFQAILIVLQNINYVLRQEDAERVA